MRIDILSAFPELIKIGMGTSIMKRAQNQGSIEFYAHDLRDYTHDLHRTIDDTPYGGGPGMLIKVEPVFEAFDALFDGKNNPQRNKDTAVIFLTPKGETLKQSLSLELSGFKRLVLVCGHYEGFDERCFVLADKCISIGDYVLTGGELPALVLADSVVRLLPDVLGDAESAKSDSFSPDLDGQLEYPQYTRPTSFRGMEVPDILLSGNHAKIAEWKTAATQETTKRLRPDLTQ